MSAFNAVLLIAYAVTLVAVWLAVTMPLLQWTLAWLEKRRDRALAELYRERDEGRAEPGADS